jgi:hypothetical protein
MEEAAPLSKVKHAKCATLYGNKAYEVDVESTLVRALPGFSIVGMADQSIQESRERIKSALASVNFQFPAQKITINLSPSDLKKEGSHFDLAIALLIAIQKERFTCNDFFIFGELGLDGKVKKTNAIFPIILSLASHTPNLRVLVPNELLLKVQQIPNIRAYGIETLGDALLFFKEKRFDTEIPSHQPNFCETILEIEGKHYFYNTQFPLDFSDVLVIGGGPAGNTSAIYAARKGIKTGIVAERMGGQVMDTMDIENYTSIQKTQGPKFAAEMEAHVREYGVDIMNLQRVSNIKGADETANALVRVNYLP